jgi:hypothetical protein
MSRNFEVQVEVFPCAADQSIAIAAVLKRWGMTIEGECENFDDNYPDDGWSFWGEISLSAETEETKHDQLAVFLPGLSVNTRWRWIDELPWDSEFTSEPSRRISPAA